MCNRKKLKVVLRDDDVSFFTSVSELDKAYGSIWGKAPISFAVIPFACELFNIIKCLSYSDIKCFFQSTPTKYIKNMISIKRYLGENKELVDFLKEKIQLGQVEIMLHGYDHLVTSLGYEYEVANQLVERTAKGKYALEELFDINVRVFVPPNNSISKKGYKALSQNKLFLLSTRLPKPRTSPVHLLTLTSWYQIIKFIGMQKIGGFKYHFPYVLNYLDGLKEFVSVPLREEAELIKSQLNFVNYAGGQFFCIYTHYHDLNKEVELKHKLYKIISYLDRIDCSYVTARNIFEDG